MCGLSRDAETRSSRGKWGRKPSCAPWLLVAPGTCPRRPGLGCPSGSCPSVLLILQDTSPLSLYAAVLAIQLPRATSDQYSVQGKYWALRYLLGMDGKL